MSGVKPITSYFLVLIDLLDTQSPRNYRTLYLQTASTLLSTQVYYDASQVDDLPAIDNAICIR